MARHTSLVLIAVTLGVAAASVVGAMAVRPDLAAPDPSPVGQGPAQSAAEWTMVSSSTDANLTSVSMMSPVDGRAVGRQGTILHYGTIEATPTPSSTPTRTPRPTGTQTLTVTPGPSPTPRPTATCPPGWEPRLELWFTPLAVRGGQAVTAHLEGYSFGFDTAGVSLSMAGHRNIQHRWRSEQGWIGSASFGFAAPASSGTWTAVVGGYGEVAFCMDGHIGWNYGGAESRQVPLEVTGAMLYLPAMGAVRPWQGAARRKDGYVGP